MFQAISQRQEKILNEAYKNGYVEVKSLSEILEVSEATIRRDLHGLAAQELLELSHGGARVNRNSDHSFLSKLARNVEEKTIIAELASKLVEDGDQIFLDSGTTCFQMTSFLRTKRSLSIISNSIRTTQELEAPGLKVMLLAGQYRPERLDIVGPMATDTLNNLRGYVAFLGTDGISRDFGITSADIESANIHKLAAQNARECILLADHSKFDDPALYKIEDFKLISTVITDKKPDEKWCKFFNKQNINVIFPQEKLNSNQEQK